VHVHHLSACREGVLEALASPPVPYGFTVHDLFLACPTITFSGRDGMYCGAQTDLATCARCLASQEAFADVDIARWRERHADLLRGAAFRVAPSRFAADTLARYFPDSPATVIAHGAPQAAAPPSSGARSVVLLPRDDVPTVAVLGAIGPDKGARRLERLVDLSRQRNAHVRFVLIGYLDFQHRAWQSDDARFTVHGHYVRSDLPELFEHYRVSLVLYPSAGPETFSYTLTEAWLAGRPVLVPPIGALAERVQAQGGGWVLADSEWRDESRMLDRLCAIAADREALARASSDTRAIAHATEEAMARATFALYEAALAGADARAREAMKPLEPARLRYALHYVGWTPPPADRARQPARKPQLLDRLARAAAQRRNTAAGRMLFRLAPHAVVAALRSRLK
jgi:hypothetical protein